MGKLARKNLVVDPERVRELARRRGTSESAAVRQAVEDALAAEEIVEAFDELAARGGIDDVFGRVPVDTGEADSTDSSDAVDEGGESWHAPKSRTRVS